MRGAASPRAAVLCLALALACAAQPALGQGAPNQKEAFAEAQKQFDAQDYAGALPKFQALYLETQSPNAHLYVARTLRELGRLAEAYDEMVATLKEATAKAEAEPKYVPTRDAAAAERALLETRVGRISIAVADAPAGVIVTLNGAEVAPDKLAAPITVAPGMQRVELSGEGFEKVSKEIMVQGGESKTLGISAKRREVVVADAPKRPVAPATETGGELRIVGIVAACLGGAGFAAFGVTYAMSDAKFGTLEDECGGRCTDPKYADVIDEGKSLELASVVSVIVGGVFAAASIPMIALGGPTTEEAPVQAVVGPELGGGVRLGITGRF